MVSIRINGEVKGLMEDMNTSPQKIVDRWILENINVVLEVNNEKIRKNNKNDSSTGGRIRRNKVG